MPPSVPYPPSTGVFAIYPMQCHCAAIQYTIKLSPPLLESESEGKGIYTALECDCTHCERKGIIACHPLLKDVEFTKGLVSSHRDSYSSMLGQPVSNRWSIEWDLADLVGACYSTGASRRVLLRREEESALGLQDLWFVSSSHSSRSCSNQNLLLNHI
jgi:hypothetical protein